MPIFQHKTWALQGISMSPQQMCNGHASEGPESDAEGWCRSCFTCGASARTKSMRWTVRVAASSTLSTTTSPWKSVFARVLLLCSGVSIMLFQEVLFSASPCPVHCVTIEAEDLSGGTRQTVSDEELRERVERDMEHSRAGPWMNAFLSVGSDRKVEEYQKYREDFLLRQVEYLASSSSDTRAWMSEQHCRDGVDQRILRRSLSACPRLKPSRNTPSCLRRTS